MVVEKFLAKVPAKHITTQGGNISAFFYSGLVPGLYEDPFNRYYDFTFGPLLLTAVAREGRLFFDLRSYQATTDQSYRHFQASGEAMREMNDYKLLCRQIIDRYNKFRPSHLGSLSLDELATEMSACTDLSARTVSATVFCESLDRDLIRKYYVETGSSDELFDEFYEKSILLSFPSFAVEADKALMGFAKKDGANCRWILSDYYLCPSETAATALLDKLITDKGGVEKIVAEIGLLEQEATNNRMVVDQYKVGMKDSLIALFNFVQLCMRLRDERKSYVQKIILMMSDIGREICERLGLPEEAFTYFYYGDFTHRGYAQPNFADNVRSRLWDVVYYFDGLDTIIEPGRSKEIQDALYARMDQASDLEVVRGMSACRGVVRGTARIIINVSEFDKFQDGDVLVTSMTRPEFVPLMKRAAAVVTEEGGVTCHAAIVSRELGIPCVIGTKNATRQFQDGDMIEVDADSGVVRKL